MIAAGPASRHYDAAIQPALSLIRKLTAARDLTQVSVQKAGFRLELRRTASAAAQP
jgi:hypothetical protein